MGIFDSFRKKKLEEGSMNIRRPGSWQIGDKIMDRYEIKAIKYGGMGIVYILYDANKEFGYLAAKTFHDRFSGDKTMTTRFARESEIWVRLGKHKHIVEAKWVRNIERRPYIFLECINGTDLSNWMTSNASDLPMLINFAIQFCDGVDYACSKIPGFVHRDIKPSNAMITLEGILKITDLGLAKAFYDLPASEQAQHIEMSSPDFSQTNVGAVFGTPEYMSPEQFIDVKEADSRSDIYSFGVMLYEMVTGRLPFYPTDSGKSFEELKLKHLEESPKDPKEISHSISDDLNDLIMKCLKKEPKNRYSSFKALKMDLIRVYSNISGEKYEEKIEISSPFDQIKELVKEDKEATALVDSASNSHEWMLKGYSLSELNKLKEAIECFDKSLAILPDQSMTLYYKGNCLNRLGKYYKAIECLDKALRLDLENSSAWAEKGTSLAKVGRHKSAIKCFDRSLAVKPEGDNPREWGYDWTWRDKGKSLFALKKFEKALHCFEKALEINPVESQALIGKACSLQMIGRVAEAGNFYLNVCRIMNLSNVDLSDALALELMKVIIEKK